MRTSNPRRAASMADDFGITPYSIFADQRVERLDPDRDPGSVMFFATIVSITNDHGLFNGSARGLSRFLGVPADYIAGYLDKLKAASLIEIYSVVAVNGVPYVVGEIVGFAAYAGQPKTRKYAKLRRQSEWPLRDGSFPDYRRSGDDVEHAGPDDMGDESRGGYRSDNRQGAPRTNRAPVTTLSRSDGAPPVNQSRTQPRTDNAPNVHQSRNEPDRAESTIPLDSACTSRAPTVHQPRTEHAPVMFPRIEEIQNQNETRGRASQPAPSVYMQDQYAYEDRARQGGADANAPLVGGRVLAPRTGVDRHEQQEPPDGYSAPQPTASPSSRAPAEAPPDEPVAPARDRARILADFEALKARVANPDAVPIRPRAPDPLPKLRLPWPSVEHETAALAAGRVFESRPGGRRLQASLVVLHGYATRPEFLAHCAAIAAQGDAWAGWEQGDAWDGLAFMFGDGVPDSIGPASSHERPVLEVLPGGAG